MSAGGCDCPLETLLLRKPQPDIRNDVHVTLAAPGVQQLCSDVEVIPPAALAQTGLDGCSFGVNQRREAS
jgi:hypothetical protein